MAEKIIDGNYKENIFYLLCNLANLDNNSIVINAVTTSIKNTKIEKSNIDDEIASISAELENAKSRKATMIDGPAAFSQFVKSFNDNSILQEYLHILGYDNCLDVFVKSHKKEQETNEIKVDIDRDIASLSDKLKELEINNLSLEDRLQRDTLMLENINNATDDVKCLIDASVSGNGSFNKDYVVGLLVPFADMAKKFGIIFPENFVEVASKAIFFPEDGFSDVVREYKSGKYKELLYTSVEKEKIDIDAIDEAQEVVIKDVPINNVETEEIADIDISDEVADDIDNIVTDDVDFSGKNVEEETEVEEESNQIADDIQVVESEDVIDHKIDDISIDVIPEETQEEISEETQEEISEETEQATDDVTEVVSEDVPDDTQEDVALDSSEDEVVEETVQEVDNTNLADKIIAEMNDEISNLNVQINNQTDSQTNKYGLDESRISEELRKQLNSADENVVKTNVETLKALNAIDDVFYYVNGKYSYLTDKDLSTKLNYLRGKGVPEKAVVSAVEQHYIDSSLESIKEGVNALENSDLGFDKKYLPIFKYGVQSFFKTLDVLRSNGIEPDDSEITAYLTILAKYSDNVEPDTEVLKDYRVSILRSNGKYGLGYMMKNPLELVQSLDDIIEIGEEDLINNVPEVLAVNTDELVKRLLFVKNNNVDYKEGEVYADYIIKPGLFNREFNNPDLENIATREACNDVLSKSSSDLSSIFIEILDRFYADRRSYKSVELSDEEKGVFEELKTMLEEKAGATLVSKNTYELNGMKISRNKFERNLSCLVSALLNNGEDLLSEANDVLYVSAFYNSRRPEGMIMNVPQEIMGESESLGGMVA